MLPSCTIGYPDWQRKLTQAMTQSKGINWVLTGRLNRIFQGLNWCKGEAKGCYFFFLLLNVSSAGVTRYRSFVRALERTLLVSQLLGCKQSLYRDWALLRVDPTRTRTDSEPRDGKTGNVLRILLKYIVYLFLCLLKSSVTPRPHLETVLPEWQNKRVQEPETRDTCRDSFLS